MKFFKILLPATLALTLFGCDSPIVPDQRTVQAQEARKVANSIAFNGQNAEIDNIKKRLELTLKPGVVGFILLMNEAGQPILYETVVGKVTSGSKRLTAPMKQWSVNPNNQLGPAPSDEGTWGTSNEFIYYWNDRGEYRQWNGKYLYSDRPFRTRIEPLVVEFTPATSPRN
jgi:hypothetical protein